MDARTFRSEFMTRILTIARSGSIGLAGVAAVSCGGESSGHTGTGDGSSGGSAGSGSGGTAASGGSGGITVDAQGGAGGFLPDAFGGTAGIGGTAGAPAECDAASPGDGGEVLDAASDAWRGELVCKDGLQGASDACPAACEVAPALVCFDGNRAVIAVYGGPYPAGTLCCYDVLAESYPCYVGRTFFIDEGVVTAPLRRGKGWKQGPAPDATLLDRATRRALGDAWARDGLFEHASVASFARFVMQLLAVGAPSDLVLAAHAAASDEVAHAELSLCLASRYLDEPVEPANLPYPAPLAIEPDLAAIAAETVMEGCIGETVATLQALAALENTTDPAVRAVLERTVLDEARHAELAWRFMAWALAAGGAETDFAIARAFAAFHPPPPRAEDLSAVDLDEYRRHGRQTAVEARAIAESILADVVQPCARALLARRPAVYACVA